jgi:hypothetical protein
MDQDGSGFKTTMHQHFRLVFVTEDDNFRLYRSCKESRQVMLYGFSLCFPSLVADKEIRIGQHDIFVINNLKDF